MDNEFFPIGKHGLTDRIVGSGKGRNKCFRRHIGAIIGGEANGRENGDMSLVGITANKLSYLNLKYMSAL